MAAFLQRVNVSKRGSLKLAVVSRRNNIQV
jgi:hypothetical protein